MSLTLLREKTIDAWVCVKMTIESSTYNNDKRDSETTCTWYVRKRDSESRRWLAQDLSYDNSFLAWFLVGCSWIVRMKMTIAFVHLREREEGSADLDWLEKHLHNIVDSLPTNTNNILSYKNESLSLEVIDPFVSLSLSLYTCVYIGDGITPRRNNEVREWWVVVDVVVGTLKKKKKEEECNKITNNVGRTHSLPSSSEREREREKREKHLILCADPSIILFPLPCFRWTTSSSSEPPPPPPPL